MNKNVIHFPKINSTSCITIQKIGSQVINLASGLMISLQINPDMSLVSLLGKGNEHSNHEAIVTWMLSSYSRDDINSMNTPVESLSKALHNHLLDCLEYAS